jgi:nucleoid-associated protein YgaU
MNKEAKIGLTIILVLLITFLAVMARKAYIYYTAEQALATDDQNNKEGDKESTVPATGKEARNSDKIHNARSAPEASSQPRVITAKTASVKPPQSTDKDDDPWNKPPRTLEPNAKNGGSFELAPRNSLLPDRHEEKAEYRYNHNDTIDSSANPEPRGKERIYSGRGTENNNDDGFQRPGRNTSYAIASARTYDAVDGDSLFDIARCKLGDASRWVELYNLNEAVLGKDIDNIAPGTRIALP